MDASREGALLVPRDIHIERDSDVSTDLGQQLGCCFPSTEVWRRNIAEYREPWYWGGT